MKQKLSVSSPVSEVFVKYNFMLYTGKGDNGTTKLFDCPQGIRLSKGSFVFEVLGTLDELNSSLGYAKALSKKSNPYFYMENEKIPYEKIIDNLQQNVFSIQAEIGGSDIHLNKKHIIYLEKVISEVETILPPIKSFIVPGGGECGAYLDVVRTVARRAERHVVLLQEKEERVIHNESIIFLNRLSSVLYALARLANYQEGFYENKPLYK